MTRTSRSSTLETRTSRLKLSSEKRFFALIGQKLALTYRRNKKGVGSWSARLFVGQVHKYLIIGEADDYKDADGVTVFSYFQAQEKARLIEREQKIKDGLIILPLTMAEAAEDYLVWFKNNRKSYDATKATIDAHILPVFGHRFVKDITTKEIKDWHEELSLTPKRTRTRIGSEQAYLGVSTSDAHLRSRKATANRILTVFKAILNKSFYDGKVQDDTTWRRVKPFPKVDAPRVRFLTAYEAERLLNASENDFRSLVAAALYTGARYNELADMRVNDYSPEQGFIFIQPSKSGKGRHIPLSVDGIGFFNGMIVGKQGNELIFTREDNSAWKKNHQSRPMKEACNKAKIEPAIGFHELRHTYASTLAQRGVDLLTISKLLGHADTRITSRHYAHLCDNTLKAAVANLPDFGYKPQTKVVGIR